MPRKFNFSAGPSALPLEVLEQVQAELVDFRGAGMSIMEMSHRGAVYDQVHNEAVADLKELLGVGDSHDLLFMGGGANTQFFAVPMNLLGDGVGSYLTTGRWSESAIKAATRLGNTEELYSSAETGHDRTPKTGDFKLNPGAAYLHYTSNNTVAGTQYASVPESGDVPLVCDMSSDILSGPIDASKFGVIYAGAQKNLGPAGVTLAVVRKDLQERSPDTVPDALHYKKMADKNSLLNTPPVFAIYVAGLVAKHLKKIGLQTVAEQNAKKAALLYNTIDGSGGFFRGHAQEDSRSKMNVTFRLPTEDLEKTFVAESKAADLDGLKGHRSVGGLRASIYNAVPLAAVEALVDFMKEFQRKNG